MATATGVIWGVGTGLEVSRPKGLWLIFGVADNGRIRKPIVLLTYYYC